MEIGRSAKSEFSWQEDMGDFLLTLKSMSELNGWVE